MKRAAVLALLGLLVLTGCQGEAGAHRSGDRIRHLVPVIVAEHPHDTSAFTQGLELLTDGQMLETTGLVGQSSIRVVDIATGDVVRSAQMPADQFGEGVTVVDDQAVSLTWKDGVVHTWGLDTLTPVASAEYSGQAWGLCLMEGVLWRSDGSVTLTAHDPQTFAPTGQTLRVTAAGNELADLNELECVNGTIWANVWKSDSIVGIDAKTGRVSTVVDASALVARAVEVNGSTLDANQVLNGIAHDADTGNWYLTGKQWPTLFEVTFEPAQPKR